MNHQLEPLLFLPPPISTPWSGEPHDATLPDVTREDGTEVSIDLPLFWFEPPWCNISAETADVLATAVGRTGIIVSALRSDLAGPDKQSSFHSAENAATVLPRMVPYRPERYGLNVRDFDGAKVIDVRLTMTRDNASGRFAFSPRQIERWEATARGEPLSGGSWVPAAAFPPDVVSIDHLSSKLNQLRVLAPQAAVFASIGPYRMEDELPSIVKTRPDGLILRLDEGSLAGLQLAALTQRARKLMDNAGANSMPLWIVPGEITPDDAVKLVALGAAGIAVDSWCDPLVAEAAERQQTATQRLGYPPASNADEEYLKQWAQYRLTTKVERFKGLRQSLQRVPPGERLGSFSSSWAKTLNVQNLR